MCNEQLLSEYHSIRKEKKVILNECFNMQREIYAIDIELASLAQQLDHVYGKDEWRDGND